MAAITDTIIDEVQPNAGLKTIVVQTKNTVDAADTIAIILADYGISATGLLIVEGWVMTTDNSVIAPETVTTSVTTGTLTVTIPAGTDNDIRVVRITGRATPNTLT